MNPWPTEKKQDLMLLKDIGEHHKAITSRPITPKKLLGNNFETFSKEDTLSITELFQSNQYNVSL